MCGPDIASEEHACYVQTNVSGPDKCVISRIKRLAQINGAEEPASALVGLNIFFF